MQTDTSGNGEVATELVTGTDLLIGQLLTTAPAEAVDILRRKAKDIRAAYAPNTLKSWKADWLVWTSYCKAEGLPALPVSLPALRGFLEDRIFRGRRKRATIEHYLATLAAFHRILDLPWPLDGNEGKLMWRGMLHMHLTAAQNQKRGITLADIDKMEAALDLRDVLNLRDAALLRFAFDSMCRRSEISAIKVSHLVQLEDGSGLLKIDFSKTDQEGRGDVQYISPRTMDLINRWKDAAGVNSGPLFRAGKRSLAPGRFANPLLARDIARIFKRTAKKTGMDWRNVSGHSTRIGATQDLLAANITTSEIQRTGRWKTPSMIVLYGRNLEASRGGMAQLHARHPPEES